MAGGTRCVGMTGVNSVLPTYPTGEVSQPADMAASRPGHSSGLRREAVTLGDEE